MGSNNISGIRTDKRERDEKFVLLNLLKDIREDGFPPVFEIEKITIGNQRYDIKAYRNPELNNVHSVYILFYEHQTDKLSFVLRTNRYDSNDNIKATLGLFFKTKAPGVAYKAMNQVRQLGYYLMDPANEMEAERLKRPIKKSESNKKMFQLVFDFAEAMEMAEAA